MRAGLRRLPHSGGIEQILRKANTVWGDHVAARGARRLKTAHATQGRRDAILLCGWYGTETLGDKAILSGLVSTLRDAGWEGSIDLASLEPFVSTQTNREMPELQLRNIETIEGARERLARGEYRLVVVAGGPLMSPVREVFDLLALFREAEAANTKRAILGCGIGPLGFSKRRDAAIGQLLALSAHTVLRDQASLDLARTRMGFRSKADVVFDPAFIWAEEQMKSANNSSADGPILLALRDWQIGEYALGLSVQAATELKRRFELELVEMVDELSRSAPQWELQPIAMNTYARGGDDRLFFQRLFVHRPDLLAAVPWKRRTPEEEFKLFRSARAVVAMRFHSAVLAIAAGVPHVAIDYTRGGKIAALLSSVGANEAMSIDGFSGRGCARRLIDAVNSRPPAAPSGVRESYTAAWRQCLRDFRS